MMAEQGSGRGEFAEELARRAERTGDEYDKLLAEGILKEDYRKTTKVLRAAIALEPDEPCAYCPPRPLRRRPPPRREMAAGA